MEAWSENSKTNNEIFRMEHLTRGGKKSAMVYIIVRASIRQLAVISRAEFHARAKDSSFESQGPAIRL